MPPRARVAQTCPVARVTVDAKLQPWPKGKLCVSPASLATHRAYQFEAKVPHFLNPRSQPFSNIVIAHTHFHPVTHCAHLCCGCSRRGLSSPTGTAACSPAAGPSRRAGALTTHLQFVKNSDGRGVSSKCNESIRRCTATSTCIDGHATMSCKQQDEQFKSTECHAVGWLSSITDRQRRGSRIPRLAAHCSP